MPSTHVYIYAKHDSQKKFRPLNLRTNAQVKLVHATRLARAEGERFLATEAKINADWAFELRDAQ